MPTINLENCIKCMLCVHDCPSNAIDIEQGTINDICIHCGHCVAICPESTVFPDEDVIKKLNPNTVLPGDFQNLSARIRTCRNYMNKEVDEGMLYLLLENMKHYPSASNARPVEISIIKAKEEIQKLNDTTARNLINTIRIFTSPLLMPILQLLAPKLNLPRLNNYKKQVCHHAPAVLLFHAPVTKYGMAAADAFIWATYTSIYANTLGLGTCFNGFIVSAMSRKKAMRKEFRIPAGHQVYSALLIGHPKVKYSNEAGRAKPKADLI